MGYKVAYNKKLNLVTASLIGVVTASELDEAVRKSSHLQNKHHCLNFLIDAREQTAVPSMTDLYYLKDLYHNIKLNYKSRAALILPSLSELQKPILFWETVCRNDGWSVMSFETQEQAIEWLNK